MMEYPFFVYGTLRPDGYLESMWDDLASVRYDGKATVSGARLIAAPHGSFPYAIPAPDDERVIGALLLPERGCGELLMRRLDQLEGHPSHYVRRLVKVHTPGFLRRDAIAWMYFASLAVEQRLLVDIPATAVPGNDWTKYDPNNSLVHRLIQEL